MSSPPPVESATPVTFPVSPLPANNDSTPSSPPATAPFPPPTNSTAPVPSPPPTTPDAPPPTPSDEVGPSPSSPPSPSNGIPSPPPPPSHRPPSFHSPYGQPPPSAPRSLTPSPGSSSEVVVPVGMLVGIVAAFAMIIGLIIVFFCRKKTRRHHSRDYGYPPSPPKVESFGRGPTNWQQYYDAQHHGVDHVVHVPPRASPPANPSPHPYPLSERRTLVSLLSPPLPLPPLAPCTSSGRSGANTPFPPPSPGLALGLKKSAFTYNDLSMATEGFSDANLLGQGGFGYVHRGVLLNGNEVAVKHLKAESEQGEREFQAEVEIISRVHHKHLVYLVGYCISEGRRMLVYEFVPNNTLDFHLHGRGRPVLDWSNRLKIALGSAKGIAYLHEDCHPKIIHRDIKSSNILLDFNFEAKVGDFGLAKFKPDNISHLSTRVIGTWGYLAPEYISSGKLTDKLDVFSFGVMLLELITGRKPADKSHHTKPTLADWARPLLKRSLEEKNYDSLVDPRLQYNYNLIEMARMVSCAAACVRLSAKNRPRMSQIVRALEGGVSLGDFDEDVTPGGYGLHGSLDDDSSSKPYDSHQHNDGMRRTRKITSASQKYASSEYSGATATSEYGLNPSPSSSEGEQT